MQVMTNASPKVLSASQIGFPCLRCLWYRANGYEEEYPLRTKRIFITGKHLENGVVEILQEEGFTVYHNNKFHEDEPDFTIEVEGGCITGRHDICFLPPGKSLANGDRLILGDIKTMNSIQFSRWKRSSTIKTYPQYVQQLHVYYYGLKQQPIFQKVMLLDDTLAVIGFNKDNSEYHIDYFKYDPEIWESIKQKCEYVFALSEPPEPAADKPHWACSYCGFKHICEYYNPQKSKEVQPEEIIDEDVELAAYMLLEARQMKAEANELEKEAKKILERFRDREAIRTGSYIIEYRPFKQTRLDTKALREKAPEIYNAYLKEVVGVKIEVMEVQ